MNTVDFKQAGGFPLTQDTLGFMQTATVDSFGALAAALETLCGSRYVILSGCEDDGFNKMKGGVVSINGEIMPFQAGEKNVGVVVVEEKTAVVYKDGSKKDAYYNKYAKFVSGGGEIPWSAFKRVPSSMPASDVYAWAKAVSKPNYTAAEVGAAGASHTHTKANITDFPTSLPASDVQAWAKAASKPSYTAAEVGAAAASHTHTKANITDFPTSLPASDVYAWAKAAEKPTYTVAEVEGAVSQESGTWTPVPVGNSWIKYSNIQNCYWQRVGNRVFINGYFIASNETGNSGNFYMSGLPYPAKHTGAYILIETVNGLKFQSLIGGTTIDLGATPTYTSIYIKLSFSYEIK